MPEFVTVDIQDEIATIRLDRPPMNALSAPVAAELHAAALAVSAQAQVRSVVLFGGDKLFAAGADVKEMEALDYPGILAHIGGLQRAFDAIAAIPKPVVAALTGYTLGGGCELALTADYRVAGDNVKIGQPEILLGIIPGAGGTQRLPRLLGPSRAKDLIFTGRFVSADEALRIGLVDRVVAPDEVYAHARAWAARFAAGPAVAIAAAKQAIDTGLQTDLRSGLDIERFAFAGLWGTQDQTRGMQSFLERGPGMAEFVGR